MAENKKFDRSYGDTLGTKGYWRDPKSGIASVAAAKRLIHKNKTGKKKSTERVPAAMEIYEGWMEPGYGPVGAPEPRKETPKPPPIKEEKKRESKNYKYFDEYAKGVKDDDPWKDKNNHNYEKQPQQKPRPKSSKRSRTPDAIDVKEDPDYVEKAKTPEPPPPKTPELPTREDDGDYGDLYDWVSNGRDDDMNKSKKLLFEKQKKH